MPPGLDDGLDALALQLLQTIAVGRVSGPTRLPGLSRGLAERPPAEHELGRQIIRGHPRARGLGYAPWASPPSSMR
jgi:hypothetical protein